MFKVLKLLALALATTATGWSMPIDSLRARLERGPVQEKVYLHLDNQCYYAGDTIWYKAYVVETEGLKETQMSRVLYVELTTPDGLLVERQQIIVSPEGYSCGDFMLPDTLHSGYYELRAYTRWMLNFNVTHRPYRTKDQRLFYNKEMARDFFREYGNICSRVVPVYQKPEQEGNWADKAIYQRSKQRLDKTLKERLDVSFFPEGGTLVAGHRQRVAFEAVNEQGEAVSTSGTIAGQSAKTGHMGRGVVEISVGTGEQKATFSYGGKSYSFTLPKAAERGATVKIADGEATIEGSGQLAVAILCRGRLQHFEAINGNRRLKLADCHLPTGVNNLIVINGNGTILADRLFFVNNHDREGNIAVSGLKDEYAPFEPISLTFNCPSTKHFSVAVRDGATDEATFDDGNLLTDLLLSSELKGFVAHPAYYFQPGHEADLDLLMMVQGWRRYDATPILAEKPLRYKPEGCLTVEGGVYEIDDIHEVMPEEFSQGMLVYQQVTFGGTRKGSSSLAFFDSNVEVEGLSVKGEEQTPGEVNSTENSMNTSTENGENNSTQETTSVTSTESSEPTSDTDVAERLQTGRRAKKPVDVHGELIVGTDVATVDITADSLRHFAFDLPPFYGKGILKLRASRQDQSEKQKQKTAAKGVIDENMPPDYYVKRDLFFPIFAKKYSWYQCHRPETADTADTAGETLDIKQVSTMDDEIEEITVKGKKRRGRRKIDYSQPVMVYDVQQMNNLVADYGLSCAYFDIRTFPYDVAYLLLGNYDGEQEMSLEARINMHTFYKVIPNPDSSSIAEPLNNRSPQAMLDNLRLKRLDKVRLFTDFELRNSEKTMQRTGSWADVTLDFVSYPNDRETYTFRDRHIVIDGFTAPRQFYNPDYSTRPLPDQKDYRRTLYWNPNAKPEADGTFTANFYNNGKQTRPRVDACAISTSGQLMTSH